MMTPQAEFGFRSSRFGNDSYQPVISVNPKYGRLYFSVFAIKALALDQGNFKIFLRGKRWILSKTTVRTDLVMKVYERAYYIVSKPLAYQLARYFYHERPSFLIEGTERKRKYYTLKFFIPDNVRKRAPRKAAKPEDIPRKDPVVLSAEKVISRYERTNFEGRIKTREILKAERILNRS